MAVNNYREQMEQFAHEAFQKDETDSELPEKKARLLFDHVSNVVYGAKKLHDIHLVAREDSFPGLRFRGITIDQPSGDRIEIAVEKRKWWDGDAHHGPRVLIGIEGEIDQSTGEGKFLRQQFMIEKNGTKTLLHYATSLSGRWEQVEDWKNNDPENYVEFLGNVFAAACQKIPTRGSVTGG